MLIEFLLERRHSAADILKAPLPRQRGFYPEDMPTRLGLKAKNVLSIL
ncbi:MAG: hypothetical protein IKD14_03935 [Clostridia bacterium]|nr:hypothetical protein [Clostridia bacterium]